MVNKEIFKFNFQVGLIDVIRSLNIDIAGVVGHSVGELGCAYAEGGLTAEQTVLAGYWRGRAVMEADLPNGAMAAVGKFIMITVYVNIITKSIN